MLLSGDLCSRVVARPAVEPTVEPVGASDAWASIELTRHPARPGIRELLRHGAQDVVPLSGTGAGEHDEALFSALASFDGIGCVVVSQDRRAQAGDRPLGPASLRSAWRAMRIAEELRRPLVCVIETPGADLSADAEEGALAPEIARCLADLVQLTVPSVWVLLGQGCGGAALALLPCARVVATEHAWLSPLPPRGGQRHHLQDHRDGPGDGTSTTGGCGRPAC